MLLKRYEVYTVSEFLNKETSRDLSLLETTLEHLKRNKKRYLILVVTIAVTIDLSGITLANETVATLDISVLESTLSSKAQEIVRMLIVLSKFTCMGMGLKDMIICLLNGGNMKEATYSGLQYWLGFLFLQFYPQLFN